MKQDHFLLPTVNYICFTVTPVPLREKYASLNMTDTALSDQDIIATHLSLLPSIRIVVPLSLLFCVCSLPRHKYYTIIPGSLPHRAG